MRNKSKNHSSFVEQAIHNSSRHYSDSGNIKIEIEIHCRSQQIAERAVYLLKRDLSSHIITVQQHATVVKADIRPLQGFHYSESIYFYHYHLQRQLGQFAQVKLASSYTKPNVQPVAEV